MKHVVDFDLTVGRKGSHDDGAGRAADALGGPEVGGHTNEGITTKDNSCGDALRPNAERAAKDRILRRFRSKIPTSRPRASAGGAARADRRRRRPLQPRNRARRLSAVGEVREGKNASDEPKDL